MRQSFDLGQRRVDAKSNEIATIPQLIQLLESDAFALEPETFRLNFFTVYL